MRRVAITGMGITSCLGNDLDTSVAAQHGDQPRAQQFMVVGNHHSHHHQTPVWVAGRVASTTKPRPPAPAPARKLPPVCRTRSASPTRPKP